MLKRRISLVLCASAAVLCAAPTASAQVPPIPPPVTDLLRTAETTVGPYVMIPATAAAPATNAAGFALRPACVNQSTIALAIGLAGLPRELGLVTKPLAALCKPAMRSGPADPYFQQVDAAVGRDAQNAAEPVFVAANPVVEEARPTIAVACIALVLANPAVPPPANRFSVANEVCWR